MSYFHILTLIFVVAKLAAYIDWSWWIVFAPSIVSISIVLVLLIGALTLAVKKDRYL